ncbi:MEDS domain-containing protein [Catellatospora sichuanensis]|uniref:MEDS domain-containing protein n=1 Tax=Catellatospora sichuanensis TaxID=1969805 RepID=UPI001642F788|nr:MEDS domain-containing protein [Catellatospora sichuanensis]
MSGTSVEDLKPGDHACLTFSDNDERLDIVAAFVRDGLRLGQKVLCLTESVSQTALSDELAARGVGIGSAARSGQLQVAASGQFFTPQGSFDPSATIVRWQAQIDQANRDGYGGLRVTGDMCWALRPVGGVADLMEYESRLTRMLAGQNATAACQFDRQCFDTVTLATAADNHSMNVTAVTYHDDALLRICRQHVPTGVRIAGEIDYRAIEPLTLALSEALSLDDHIDVNLTQLRFMDTTTAGVIVQTALGLTGRQRMTVRCTRISFDVLAALGMQEQARVTLTTARHGD